MIVKCFQCGKEDDVHYDYGVSFHSINEWMPTENGWICVQCQYDNVARFIRTATDKEFFDMLSGTSKED